MKKETLLAISAAIIAIANDLGTENESPTGDAAAPADAPKRRGRPPGTAAPDDKPPAAEPAPPTATGKTYEQLQALIRPLVEEGRGEEVKKVIAKYSAGGLKELQSKDHAAFEKDISALQY